MLGAIIGRTEAQVIRIALIYALLDQRDKIDLVHLEAAIAVWEYCEASARYIFGDALGDPIADEILQAVRQAGEEGLSCLMRKPARIPADSRPNEAIVDARIRQNVKDLCGA